MYNSRGKLFMAIGERPAPFFRDRKKRVIFALESGLLFVPYGFLLAYFYKVLPHRLLLSGGPLHMLSLRPLSMQSSLRWSCFLLLPDWGSERLRVSPGKCFSGP